MLTTFQNSDKQIHRQMERERNMQIIHDALNLAPVSNIEEASIGAAAVDSLAGESFEQFASTHSLSSGEDDCKKKTIHPLFWALSLVVLVITASILISRKQKASSVYDPRKDPALIDRYNRLHHQILEWKVTNATVLDATDSPSAKALDWLAYEDIQTSDNDNIRTRFALATIYFSTFSDASSWHTSTFWLSDYPVCFWHGIGCVGDEEDQIHLVQGLNLSSNGLVGVVPNEIALLRMDCESLDLSNNHIHGRIPDVMGVYMTNLERLYLGQNMLTGSIPVNIFRLTGLKHLFLENNQLSGVLPSSTLGHMSELQGLALHENYLWGRIPTSIGGLKKLRALYLDTNAFTGPIPSSIGSLTALVDLRLHDNRLNGELPTGLSELRMLEILYLHHNKFSGPLSNIDFSRMPILSQLQLQDNGLEGEIPSAIGRLALLKVLYLDGNLLTGGIPALASNRLLETVYLNNNILTGPLPTDIGERLHKLSHLRVQQNHLTGDIPSTLGKLVALETLYMNNNTISGYPPSELGRLYSLKEAHFHGNSIIGHFPDNWCSSHGGLFSPVIYELTADCNRDNLFCDCCTLCFA